MKKLLLFTTLFSFTILFAQDEFKKGYYIDNFGIKIEGFIKTSNFRTYNDNSFTAFEFKKELNQTIQTIEKANVSAFGAGLEVKYQKRKALIDDVSFFDDNNNDKNFTVQEKTVFLNVLVEGLATLYSYDGGQGTKYLWTIAGQDEVAKQFLYKQYYKSKTNLAENNTFREQLFNHVKCPNQTFNDFLKVKYEEGELIALFKNYNKCSNSPFVVYENEKEVGVTVNLSLLIGYNIGNFQVVDWFYSSNPSSFGMPSIGVDVELLLESQVVAFFVSAEYKHAKVDNTYVETASDLNPSLGRRVFTYRLDTAIIDVALGMRWYNHFKNAGSLFIGGGGGIAHTSGTLPLYGAYNFSPNSKLIGKRNLGYTPFATIQVGYVFKKKYGIDLNIDSNKNLFGNMNSTASIKFSEVGLNLRYSF
jgi:hypothetical protein